MKFTQYEYPRYAVRLKSGSLAYCRCIATQEKATAFFRKRDTALNWLRAAIPGGKSRGRVVELDFGTWWHALLENPTFRLMAIDVSERSMGLIEVAHILDQHYEISQNGHELSVDDLARFSDEATSVLYSSIVADEKAHIKQLLDNVRRSVESSDTFRPTLFAVQSDLATIQQLVVDDPRKLALEDLLITFVREGYIGVGIAMASVEKNNKTLHLKGHACKPGLIYVGYEEEGLVVRCTATVESEGDQRVLSDWKFIGEKGHEKYSFKDIFVKARALGPAPATRDELAKEMRRDLAGLARAKGNTDKITFCELASQSRPHEIRQLEFRWDWQCTSLLEAAGADAISPSDPNSEEAILDYLPLRYWEVTIDPMEVDQ